MSYKERASVVSKEWANILESFGAGIWKGERKAGKKDDKDEEINPVISLFFISLGF